MIFSKATNSPNIPFAGYFFHLIHVPPTMSKPTLFLPNCTFSLSTLLYSLPTTLNKLITLELLHSALLPHSLTSLLFFFLEIIPQSLSPSPVRHSFRNLTACFTTALSARYRSPYQLSLQSFLKSSSLFGHRHINYFTPASTPIII